MSQAKKSSIGGKSTCHLLHLKKPEEAKRSIRLKFQRTSVQVTSRKHGKTFQGSMGLLDISEAGVGLFTDSLLLKGTKVQFHMDEPRTLNLSAVVAWSIPVKGAVPKANMKFRTGLQFYFEGEEQRKSLIDFLALLRVDPLEALHIKTPEAQQQPAVSEAPAPSAEAIAAPAVASDTPPPSEVPPSEVKEATVEAVAAGGADSNPSSEANQSTPEAEEVKAA
jgi:hypothetical protein